MKNTRAGTVWMGLGLIAAGIAVAAAMLVGWDKMWPIFPVIGGLALLVGYLLGGAQDGGLAFLGTAALLIGLFFFGFTLGVWDWGDMSRLWPIFPVIGGVALLVLFLVDRRARRDLGLLGVALAAIVAGIVGLLYTWGYVSGDILKYWPVLLILIGVLGLLGAFIPRSSKL